MCWITFRSAPKHRHKHDLRRFSIDASINTLDVCDEPPRFVSSIIPTTSHPRSGRSVRKTTPMLPVHQIPHQKLHNHHHDNHDHRQVRRAVLHGHGMRRSSLPHPPPPPPPSPMRPSKNVHFEWSSLTERIPRPRGNEEQRYRTVIAAPSSRLPRSTETTNRSAVRARTREALLEVREPGRRSRGRLRRVAGRDVLTAEVPWSWECIEDGGRRRYPPFGPVSDWM